MTIQSNLYIEKISSEHPIAAWMLNDQLDYISLLTEAERQISNGTKWSVTNATPSTVTSVGSGVVIPFTDSYTTRILGSTFSTPATRDIVMTSSFYTALSEFNTTLNNVSVSGNLYVKSVLANSVSFGYKYFNGVSTVEVLSTKTLTTANNLSWVFFSATLALPPVGATNIQFVFKINVSSGGASSADYDFYLNGITFGQWAEEFNKTSLGLDLSTYSPPANFIPGLSVVPAVPYGISDKNGYYVVGTKDLYAKNFGIPIVYGSSNVTKLYYNSTGPSLVFPGYGFLNNRGKYNTYTAEMWVKINADSPEPHRIFGPAYSNDGLYVEGSFLTFVIGNKYASHYVGEWYRPMLINIIYIQNNISILLNGEQVINIPVIESELTFPNEFNGSVSQDWLCFYAHPDIYPLEIDSFALYSYAVPVEVAKRRWVWGQGVIAPEQTGSALNATTAFNDYTYSDYSVNYNYPDFGKWDQAFYNNVSTTTRTLELPNYTLPDLNFGTKTLQNFYDDNKLVQNDPNGYKYFTFKPNSNWNSIKSSAYFSEYGFLAEPVESFYGLFSSSGSASNELLFRVENKITKEYFKAVINNTTVTYSAKFVGMSSEQTLGTKTIVANQRFLAGVNVPTLSAKSITSVKRFFSNESILSIYLFGDGSVNTFSGKIYSFNFDNKYNNRKLSAINYSDGFFDTTLASANIVLSHTANYTLEAFEKYGLYFLDVSVAGYWQDYMPLSYFAKYVTDFEGIKHYDLDMIQFNIDYPEPIEIESVEITGTWNYDDLYIWFRQDTTRTYQSLDNSSYTGWANYSEMAAQTTQYSFYNTSDNYVRSYVTFQPVVDGANSSLLDYSNIVQARTNGIVDTISLIGEWENSAYEVVDGSIIFPPEIDQNNEAIDFNNYALVYHLDFNAKATLQNKIKIKNLQLASQVLERSSFTEIGTKFAVPVYPFSKLGTGYNFKGKNYSSTYKGTTPHLYMTRHSGWRIRKPSDDITERGISMPINIQEASNFDIKGIQMWIRYSDVQFPQSQTRVFSLEHNDGVYDFYVLSDSSGQRGYIYGKDRISNSNLENLQYYINGIPVAVPYLVNQEWAVLGIQFPENISFSNDVGRLNLNGPFTYNNTSVYLVTNLERVQSVVYRSWEDVRQQIWSYWITRSWEGVYVFSSSSFGILNFDDIYKKYVGTNRIIIDDPTKGILMSPDRMRFYGTVSWRNYVQTPV